VLINETMAAGFGKACEAGSYIKFQYPAPGKEYRIAGIVNDFYLNGLWRKPGPIALRYASPEDYRYMTIKFELKSMAAVSENLRQEWKILFPHLPYEGFFMTDTNILLETVQITDAIKKLFFYVSLIVLMTSGLGLLALVSLNIVKRTKEIGIRRAAGAKRKTILGQFILEAFVVIGLGAAIGFLLAVSVISLLAALPVPDFKEAVGTPELNPMVAVVTILILGTIGFLAGFFPARRASRLNIVDCLRY